MQAAVEYMQQEHGVDLAEALAECVSQHGSLIAWRGGPLTYCGSGGGDPPDGAG